MTGWHCLCGNNNISRFKEYLRYENETVFEEYEGTTIVKCLDCGLLKTVPGPQNKRFNPRVSGASFYDTNVPMFTRLFQPVVEKIKKYQAEGAVLDVGCSSGLLIYMLRKEGYTVAGIEPNYAAYRKARSRMEKDIFHGTLNGFLRKKHKQTFDCVVYNHVFEHIENIGEEVRGIKKVLKKGGILVIGVPNADNIIFFLRQKYWEPLVPDQHIWHFSAGYLIRYLQKHGFRLLDKSFDDDSREEYPWVKRLYFTILTTANKLMGTGEAVLLIMEKL